MIERMRLRPTCVSACTAAVLALVACATARASTHRFARLKPGVELGDYAYRFVGRGRVKDHIVETTVKTTAAGTALRVVFGYQDERNHYYAQVSDTDCMFVKVEAGIEQRIGTASSAQLPRDATVRVSLIRWRYTMALWLDGRQVAEAYDGTFRSGRVALAARTESAAIDTVKFQVVGDVRLSDDFMRTEGEHHVWQTVSGTWELKSLRDASMSANAFMFAGKAQAEGAAALTARGNWFWHNYTLTAACRPMGDDAVGLAFYFRGPGDHHLLRWESRNKGGRLQLIRVAGKSQTVLGSASVGFTPGQWYRLGVQVVGRRVSARIDGHALLSVVDPMLISGSIGLYCEGTSGAHFDDIEVAVPRDFAEDFEREVKGKWTEYGGTWTRRAGSPTDASAPGGFLAATAKGEARCICGEQGWDDYSVGVDFVPPASGGLGLVAHYQDEANYYLLSLSREAVALTKVAEGKPTVLARQASALPAAGVHRLELSVERGILTGRLDGKVLVRRADTALRRGQAGLFVRGAEQVAFDNVAVTMPRRPKPLFTPHGIFVAETSMAKWAVQQSDWLPVSDTLVGRPATVQWHRADFPGHVEVEAKLERLSVGGRAWVVLGGDGKSAASGYRVCLARTGNQWRVAIERGTKEVAQRALSPRRPPRRFGAERVGHAVVAHLDGEVALIYEDASPLPGRRIAWAGTACKLAKNGINLTSRSVEVYSFHRAPVDWRPVSGMWEVTNRWQCDPRWSFFAGEEREHPLVAMWNKRRFGPEVTLEFAAGIRHNPGKGGTSYSYASDINAVICGDGVDLRNGYNFVFGGWRNRYTRILRDGKVVASTSSVRMPASSSQHRYWFYVKVQKHGRRLRFYVDNALALEYNDPTPLTGRKAAIWTWSNDIMVARVRVSTPGAAPCEAPPGPPPGTPHCIYR